METLKFDTGFDLAAAIEIRKSISLFSICRLKMLQLESIM